MVTRLGHPLYTLEQLNVFLRHDCFPFSFKRLFKRFAAWKSFI